MINRIGSGKPRGKDDRPRFEYKERTKEDVKKRAEQQGGRFDSPFKPGIDTFRPKVGDNQIRILPPTWDNHDHYGLDVWMHKFIGADNSNYLCLRKMLGHKCPICAAAEEAERAGEADEAKALQPQRNVLMWVLDRDGDDPTVPQLYTVSWSADRDIASLCINRKTGKVLVIDHPDEGYDVIIKRVGQGLKTRYQYQIDRDSTPIEDDVKVQDDILEQIAEMPLTEVLLYYDEDYLEKVISGTTPERDKDKDDDDNGRSSRRGRGRDKDEEEEPRGRRRGRRDEEEEEEEAPRGRRGRDKDADDDPPRRGRRGREEPEDEDPPRRRGRDRDEPEDEDPPRRRGRDRDEPEDDDRSSRRSRREEPEEEDPPRRRGRDKDEPEERTRRERVTRREEPEEEEAPRGRRSRSRDEEPEDEDPPRRRSRTADEDERPARGARGRDKDADDDPPRRRRSSRDDDGDAGDDEDVPFDKDDKDAEEDAPRRRSRR